MVMPLYLGSSRTSSAKDQAKFQTKIMDDLAAALLYAWRHG